MNEYELRRFIYSRIGDEDVKRLISWMLLNDKHFVSCLKTILFGFVVSCFFIFLIIFFILNFILTK